MNRRLSDATSACRVCPLMCVLGSEVRPHRIPLPAQPSPHLGTRHWSRCRDFRLEMLSVRCLRECSGCAVDGRSLG
jgi:hypothetical protein